MSQAVTQPPSNRMLLGILALLVAVHVARIVGGRAFPGAWNDVGGILLCLAVAYPWLPPGRSLLHRGQRTAFSAGFAALLVGSAVCTFVLAG